LREVLGASEVAFFGGAAGLVHETFDFINQVVLLRIEPLSVSLLEIALGDTDVFRSSALEIGFLGLAK
jgi:hypothetical protein